MSPCNGAPVNHQRKEGRHWLTAHFRRAQACPSGASAGGYPDRQSLVKLASVVDDGARDFTAIRRVHVVTGIREFISTMVPDPDRNAPSRNNPPGRTESIEHEPT